MENNEYIEDIEDIENTAEKNIEIKSKAKRGRPPKNIGNIDVKNVVNNKNEQIPKKRGRKPKGGKIVPHNILMINEPIIRPSIILHLKCSINDLFSNSINNENFTQPYGNNSFFNNELVYEVIHNKNNVETITENVSVLPHAVDENKTSIEKDKMKEIWKKLKQLDNDLHFNTITNNRSDCFWCTCGFDTPSIYIPSHFIKDSYNVYGCFCSPECAVAYLMNENIDSSVKFERYSLINSLYGKIFNHTQNIKPAPNPYYLLDKYYGNLTINEYRTLLTSDRLFIVIDKPITKVLPEIHEDNTDYIISNKIIPSNTYQVKKRFQKNNKSNILNENFGITNHTD